MKGSESSRHANGFPRVSGPIARLRNAGERPPRGSVTSAGRVARIDPGARAGIGPHEPGPVDGARWVRRRRIGMARGSDALARLRASPAVLNVTLGLPRVLLRAPYGPAGEQVAAFPFDEGLR